MSLTQTGGKEPLRAWRLSTFLGAVGLVFAIFVIRLVYLQVLQYDTYFGQAEENRIQEISLQPQRGVIYDRNGVVLAQNIASYNVAVTPAFLPDDTGEVQEIELALAEITGVPFSKGTIDDP